MDTDQLRSLIERRRRYESRRSIANNAGVGHGWLEKFVQGKTKYPRVNQYLRLVAYLEANPDTGQLRTDKLAPAASKD